MRLSNQYGMTWRELIGLNFSELYQPTTIADLDWNPPGVFVDALAEKTRIDPDRIRHMTVAGWCPLLIDPLEPLEEKYTNYTCQYEIVIKTSWKKRWHSKSRRWPINRAWVPWVNQDYYWKERRVKSCTACLKDNYYIRLHWRLAWMVTCPIHSMPLDDWTVIETMNHYFTEVDPELFARTMPSMYRLDSLTMQAVTEGRVLLPNDRILGAGSWLRLLRGLLDDLTAPPSVTQKQSDLIDGFWEEAALNTRGSYSPWRPIEETTVDKMRDSLKVAAVAVDHLLINRCVAMGADGSLLNAPAKTVGDIPSTWSPRLPRWTLPPDPFVDPKKMTYEQRHERLRREIQHMFACIAEEQAAAGRPWDQSFP
jgi:hypothetical protein